MEEAFKNLSLSDNDPTVIAIIPEAFRLHSVLDPDPDVSSDEFTDEEDMFPDSSEEEYDSDDEDSDNDGDAVSDESEIDEDDEGDDDSEQSQDEGDDEDEDRNEDQEADKTAPTHLYPLIRVQVTNRLLRPAALASDICANSNPRPGMWATDPKMHLSNFRLGFVSQIAQLCLHSKVYYCEKKECIETRNAMAKWAPACNWDAFREWALVAMSCQAGMNSHEKLSRAHTHLARAASGSFKILKKCVERKDEFSRYLKWENAEENRINLSEVFNLIYWMAGIQSQIGTGPAEISQWNHRFLPIKYTISDVRLATQKVNELHVCKNRLWNLVNVSDRKHDDLLDIVTAIASHPDFVHEKEHDACTPSMCQEAQMNSTKVQQLHKCEGKPESGDAVSKSPGECSQQEIPVELLEANIELGKSTAWLCDKPRLSSGKEDYIAISHVWSDGTGVGVKKAGTVNSCLWNFFTGLAKRLDCKAVWWDTLSIPSEPKARNKALNMMHSNYADAKYTVVHDSYLLNFEWSPDGAPCLALVLSTWFTRGWTALELAMAKSVKVLFKNPKGGEPLIKDLDHDILARSPRQATRAHWLATTLIQRLRRRIEDVGDLVAILAPRCTSWARDRSTIASLLAGVPDADFSRGESEIIRDVLQYLGKIPYYSLLHGRPTMCDHGGYSWSTATLEDLPVETHGGFRASDDFAMNSVLEIDESGAVWGVWFFGYLEEIDYTENNIEPYGDDIAATLKVQLALADWQRCLLLRPVAKDKDPKALLVAPLAVLKDGPTLKCRYIGTVKEGNAVERYWRNEYNVQIGGPDNGQNALKGWDVVWNMGKIDENSRYNENDELMLQDAPPPNVDSEDEAEADDGAEEDPEGNSENDQEEAEGEAEEEPEPEPEENQSAPVTSLDLAEWLAQENSGTQSSSIERLGPQNGDASKDLTPNSLNKALEANSRGATRFLIRKGVRPDDRGVKFDTGSKRKSDGDNDKINADEKLARGQTLLADVYLESGLISEAISVYRAVAKGPWATSKNGKNSLPLLDVHFSLGQAYMKLREDLLERKYISTILDQDQCFEKAEKIFKNVLRECKDKGNWRAVELKKKPSPATGASNSKPGAANQDSKDSENTQRDGRNELVNGKSTKDDPDEQSPASIAVARRSDGRKATKWLQLELQTSAEMIELAMSRYDFGTATSVYKDALRHFGTAPEVFEGFTIRWDDRKKQPANIKKKRDEEAASVYQRTLKRLTSLFKKSNLMHMITKLSLGVNYYLRSKFKEAETHLKEALTGILAHTQHSAPPQAPVPRVKEVPILVPLARYHLGLAYLQQERSHHAYNELSTALELTPENPDCMELRNSISLALSKCYLIQNKFVNARKSAQYVIDFYEGRVPNFETDIRLWLEANATVVRALGRSGKQDDMELAASIGGRVIKSIENLDCFPDNGDTDLADILSIVAVIDEKQGDADGAIKIRQGVCDMYKELEGSESVGYLKARLLLAQTFQMFSRFVEAENEFTAALKGFQETLGEYASRSLTTEQEIGRFYLKKRDMEKAEQHCNKAFRGFQKRYGNSDNSTAVAAYDLGNVYFQSCKFTHAENKFSTASFGLTGSEPKIRKLRNTATVNLADSFAALGGPKNEPEAEKHYNQVLKDLEDQAKDLKESKAIEENSRDQFRVMLKKGELLRQRQDFCEAETLIVKAFRHFMGQKSNDDDKGNNDIITKMMNEPDENDKNDDNVEDGNNENGTSHDNEDDNGSKNDDDDIPLEVFEAMLRLGEVRLHSGRTEELPNGERLTPKDLIQKAKEGLVEGADVENPLRAQARVVCGEISLDPNCTGDCEGEKELKAAVDECEKALPPGSPMTIKAMDFLINHWAKHGKSNDESNAMKVRKLNALKKGYGRDTAIAIMKMTDPKREDRAVWTTPDWDDSDDGDGETNSQPASPESDQKQEEPEAWSEDHERGLFEEHGNDTPQSMIEDDSISKLRDMVNDEQYFTQRPYGPELPPGARGEEPRKKAEEPSPNPGPQYYGPSEDPGPQASPRSEYDQSSHNYDQTQPCQSPQYDSQPQYDGSYQNYPVYSDNSEQTLQGQHHPHHRPAGEVVGEAIGMAIAAPIVITATPFIMTGAFLHGLGSAFRHRHD